MALTIPQLTLFQTPSKFSPVYAPNWYAFTASVSNTTATQPYLIVDINILDQSTNALTVLENAGRYKVPIRTGNTFVFNPETILKSYVTYPFNNPINGGVYNNQYVNEVSGFGSPTSSFPTLAPDTDGIVRYNMRYGLEYNPGFTFSQVSPLGATQTIYLGAGVNMFANIGDVISIQVSSGLYSYYNGTASILNIFNDGTSTFIVTNQPGSTTLGTLSGGYINGNVYAVQHMYGTSSTFWAYNGTRQYNEKDVNFDNIYLLRELSASGGGYTSSLFPSSSTSSNIQFMNDWGRTASQAIPIKQGQSERIRFLADLIFATGAYSQFTQRIYDMKIDTYDTGMNLVSTVYNSINDAPGGPLYTNKCFTLQVFNGKETIIDGYRYKITVRGYGHLLTPIDYTSIWYIGDTKCSRYENMRIKFMNRQGSWSYFNFNKDNKQTSNIKRTEYKQPFQYDYSVNSSSSGFSLGGQRGQNLLSLAINDTFTLNSDWISEDMYSYLQQLVTSPQVFIFYDTYTLSDNTKLTGVNIPIILTDNTYQYKTINRERIFNLVINYKYAYDTNIQNP